jgi:RNA polymerase sigma-70 factor (ECF subfamily)
MSTSDPNSSSGDVQEARVTALLVRAVARDQGAWRELIGLYGPRVFAMANSRVRNEHVAEELTQGVFATVCAKLGTGEYEEQGRFESWLFRITMNRVRDLVRQRHRTQRILGNQVSADEELDAPTRGAGSEVDGEGARRLTRLREAMERLPEADREIIELRHHGGLSFKQMSDLLGEPLGTLLARHHRAIGKLREMLADVGI